MNTVIKLMNRNFREAFSKFPGVKVYEMTQPLTRKTKGATETIPSVVDQEGEGKWVGIDDTAPLIIYHRSLSPMQILTRPLSGYGDSIEAVNVYSNAVIAYFDPARLCLSADEVQRLLQVNMPGAIKLENFKAIRIILQNVVLNSQQVYQSEYQNGKIIDPKVRMFQMSYQIESRFAKSCFATCP